MQSTRYPFGEKVVPHTSGDAWLTRPRSQRSRSDEELSAKVRASFLASGRTYGARRGWHDLLAEGVSCGLHRIERFDAITGSQSPPATASPAPDLGERQVAAVAPNVLDRTFEVPAPNRKWIADFTYVWTIAAANTPAKQFQKLMAGHGVICSMSRSGNVGTTLRWTPNMRAKAWRPIFKIFRRRRETARRCRTRLAGVILHDGSRRPFPQRPMEAARGGHSFGRGLLKRVERVF
jgi:transposase InsO family protein